MAVDGDGYVLAAALNRAAGLGVYQRYRRDQLPHHITWRQLGSGTYVVAMEPSTNRDAGRFDARDRGELEFLAPGEQRHYELEIGALHGADAIEEFAASARGSWRRCRRSPRMTAITPPRLSAGILTADLTQLGTELDVIRDRAHFAHVDVMDGQFCPQLTVGAFLAAGRLDRRARRRAPDGRRAGAHPARGRAAARDRDRARRGQPGIRTACSRS